MTRRRVTLVKTHVVGRLGPVKTRILGEAILGEAPGVPKHPFRHEISRLTSILCYILQDKRSVQKREGKRLEPSRKLLRKLLENPEEDYKLVDLGRYGSLRSYSFFTCQQLSILVKRGAETRHQAAQGHSQSVHQKHQLERLRAEDPPFQTLKYGH